MSEPSEKHRETASELLYAVDAMPSDGHILAVAQALANAEREGMKRGFLAGFNASGEGWNGEYPFSDQLRHPESSCAFVAARDRFLSECGEG